MKIPDRIDKEFIIKAEVVNIVLEVIRIMQVDSQVTRIIDGLN